MRVFSRAALVFAVALSGCSEPPPAALPPPPAAQPPPAVEVTILFTSDEHGWVLPFVEKGKLRGGAAEMLARWVADEGHCVAGSRAPACADPRTLVLSGGDNYTGPALSTYFEGRPMAEALARMGYAASAFGNHELDFGMARFLENRAASRVSYLAANLRAPAGLPDMKLPAFAVFQRRGVKIGVVGAATETTLTRAMASRFEGITFEAEEPALDRAVRDAWAAGVDALVAIVHECPDVLAPIVARHPEWKLSFVGAGHCHKQITSRGGAVAVISPGWRLESYVRVKLRVDPARAAQDRVVSVEPTVVEIARDEGAQVAADPEIARAAAEWKAKLDRELGEEIGFAGAGFDKDSPVLAQWIAGAVRAETGVDVVILNSGGFRQALPKGPITKAAVWSILPFDNKIVELELTGSDIVTDLARDEAVASGVTKARDGRWHLPNGKPIDPKRRYRVATTDFLFYGGDKSEMRAHATSVVEKRLDWRTPVIEWTRKQRTSSSSPLEPKIR